ncbi:MAG: hypothetical protein ACM3WU_07685 [Bacillota bacterium]
MATLAWNARSYARYAESYVRSIYERNADAPTQLERAHPYLEAVADSLDALYYLDPARGQEWEDMRISIEEAKWFVDNQRGKLLESGSLTAEALAGIKATGKMLEILDGAFPVEISRGQRPRAVFKSDRFEAAHAAALDYINNDLTRTVGD